MKRKVEVEEIDEQMVRITFTTGISGRFIDMTLEESKDVSNKLINILRRKTNED